MEIGQAIRGTRIETPNLTPEEHQYAREELERLVPPPELERSLAKLAIQVALEPSFSVKNHITCASPQAKGRTWMGAIAKVRHQKFGDTKGFDPSDYEIEAVMQDLDEVIWGEV